MSADLNLQGITEEDIAEYLVLTPGFFERHATLLATIQLVSPLGKRVVSLQERQMEMLRDRIKGLEQRLVDMIRNAQDNESLHQRLLGLANTLMLTADASQLPGVLCEVLREQFQVPAVGLRLWGVTQAWAHLPCTEGVSAEVRSLAASLGQPYCGANSGFEAAQWLEGESPGEGLSLAQSITSIALIQLQRSDGRSFGLLALGSPDPARFGADMDTDVLRHLGHLAQSALSRLLG
ncbi:DUF484 family protein [Amphibiibacter pelophylacis]|uniref:DUF484 family protein n=1 Tax=Amphibiibacter pelophylacis TaxID=1799477 RepID=A0ACC6P266_9BURK